MQTSVLHATQATDAQRLTDEYRLPGPSLRVWDTQCSDLIPYCVVQATDAQRLTDEYRRLVDGFQGQGLIQRENEGWLANPALPDDILREAVRAFEV